MALAGYAVGATHGFVLVRSEYPLLASPALEAAIAAARARRAARRGHPRLGLRLRRDESSRAPARTSSARRRRCSPACRACAARSRRARRSPPSAACYGMPTVVNNVETLCNIPFIAARGAEAYRALSPERDTPAPSSSASTSASRARASYEVPFGMTVRELCEDVAGGLRRRARDQGACRSAARSAASCPASLLDTPFDFDALAADGCMVGHGWILAFDERTDMRERRPPPAALRRRTRAAASASRAGSGCAARTRCSHDAPRSTARGSRSCWRRSRSAACARTAAACRRRSAACSRTSPTSWGCA